MSRSKRRSPSSLLLLSLAAAALSSLAGCPGVPDSTLFTGATSAGTGGATSSSSAGGGGSGGSGGAGGGATCGNGVLEGTEECDDGDLTSGDGCDNDCSFTCVAGDPTLDPCDDENPCNGVETCGADHACAPGEGLPDGAACGVGEVCIAGNCVVASCGDGLTTSPEQCDDGNATPGDGCENDCTFTCDPGPPAQGCASQDPCAADGSCDGATHTCSAGAPLADGTACGSGQICVAGACAVEQCGDGILSGAEQCDFGAGNAAGSGCELTCTFSCIAAPNTCDDANLCNGAETCDAALGPNGGAGQACAPGVPAADGTPCGGVEFCKAGACTTAACGDGVVEGAEQCDLGAGNGPGTGCEASCQLSCTQAPDSCVDQNACNGVESCVSKMVGGQVVQSCKPGANAPKCVACLNGLCSDMGACVASTCGDGCLDAGKGEQCDPPNGTTCNAACQINAVCGDGVLESEQCDDGDLAKLDGCDGACKYEMYARMTKLEIQGMAAPAFCLPPTNRIGTQSFTPTALGQVNPPLQDAINQGTTNVITQLIGLDDLTGVADPNGLAVGIMSGFLDPAKGPWPAPNNPIDWWFRVDASGVDANDTPVGLLGGGTLAARALAAGPDTVTLQLLLAGSPAVLQMRSARIAATLNGNPPPNAPPPPPAPIAAGLTTFQTITADGVGQGLCGNITVESLSQIPAPEALCVGGATACGVCIGSRQYTYCGLGMPVGPGCNSLLDVLVGGCRVVLCFVPVVNAQQPDVAGSDNDIDALSLGAGNKVPANQVTGNDDAYSSYLKFNANRAHVTGKQ